MQFAARACACIYDTMHMFALHTLPWYWKALILVYDVAKCWQQQNANVRNSADVHATTVHVFLCQLLFAFVLMGPSLLLSVKDRRSTSMFVSEMLLLLSSYLWLIRGIATKMLSPAHACFCLQFCSCYFFFCFFSVSSLHSTVLLGNSLVRWGSLAAMCVFPVMFSHLPTDCMHLSPYVLIFLFAGELSACVCTGVSMALCSIESVIDTVYVRIL